MDQQQHVWQPTTNTCCQTGERVFATTRPTAHDAAPPRVTHCHEAVPGRPTPGLRLAGACQQCQKPHRSTRSASPSQLPSPLQHGRLGSSQILRTLHGKMQECLRASCRLLPWPPRSTSTPLVRPLHLPSAEPSSTSFWLHFFLSSLMLSVSFCASISKLCLL